jgi:hypothetical protein
MKKFTVIGILVCLVITLCACGKNEKKLVDMSTYDTCDYQAIVWKDKTYVPYCAISNSERGEQIGIVKGNKDHQIYQYGSHPVEEWIISFNHSGEMDNSMLMRELSVTKIPEGIQSQYDWNN